MTELPEHVKIYIVGGYVRDRLLCRDGKDHDYVVVGATPEDMINAGFKQVGADFPVFLHPVSGDEYALARTERKTGKGYHGFETDFSPETTLEEDLERRDLTMNAMAREVLGWNEEGHAKLSDEVIDPFNGQRDLKRGILRHVSKAFADDPVRVLRVARFAARYNFDVAKSTMNLMKKLVDVGELDHLVPERVWTEFEKAMGEDQPSKFFWTLQSCGAYEKLFAELGRSIINTGYSLSQAALLELPTIDRLMLVFSGIELEDAEAMLDRLKAPSEVHRLSRKMKLVLDFVEQKNSSPEGMLDLFNKIDAFNNNEDLKLITFTILTCHYDRYKVKISSMLVAFRAARQVSFRSLSNKQRSTLAGKKIGQAINKLRLKKIKQHWPRG